MRDSPGTLWTADQAYPPAATLFDELRHARKRPRRPAVAVLSGHGTVDPRHPAFEEGALVLTSETGAARLRGRLPRAATMLTIGPDASLDPAGGPRTLGALVAAGLVDELFLTTSPLLAGRTGNGSRPALVEGIELLPATTVGCELLTLRRAGSHLFSRYRVSGPDGG